MRRFLRTAGLLGCLAVLAVGVGCEKEEAGAEPGSEQPEVEQTSPVEGTRPDAFLMSTAGPYPAKLLGTRVDLGEGAVDLGGSLGDECTRLVESEEVAVDGERDETIMATATVQEQLGLEPSGQQRVRIEYKRTRNTRITDAPEYESCVDETEAKESEGRITAVVAGTGTLYTPDGDGWKKAFEFEDAYFLAVVGR